MAFSRSRLLAGETAANDVAKDGPLRDKAMRFDTFETHKGPEMIHSHEQGDMLGSILIRVVG